MTRMKIRDRENRKIITEFWDMADFFQGKSGSNTPSGGPLDNFLTIQHFEIKFCLILEIFKCK